MYDLILSGIRSSYAENHLGDFFYSTALAHKPKLTVELGSFMGYSSLHIAAALRDNKDTESEFHLIDLWDQYPYRHCSMETIVQNFKKNELLSLPHCKCSFINEDVFEADSNYSSSTIDLLHIDISNDGQSLQHCLNRWHEKLNTGGILLFEGGSEERDRIDWMIEYGKKSIRSFTESAWFGDHYEAVTIQPFPSLTFARKMK